MSDTDEEPPAPLFRARPCTVPVLIRRISGGVTAVSSPELIYKMTVAVLGRPLLQMLKSRVGPEEALERPEITVLSVVTVPFLPCGIKYRGRCAERGSDILRRAGP